MGFQTYRYDASGSPNRSFRPSAFFRDWHRYVGSVHRHWHTGQLVLCWSTNGPHQAVKEALRAHLEATPGNAQSLLFFVDRLQRRRNRAAAREMVK